MNPYPIAATLRTVADVIEDAMRVGVPEPQTVSVTWHAAPTLIMGTFPDVEEWALYLETETVTHTSGGGRVEHIDADGDLTDPRGYGIGVKVTTNRAVPCAAWDSCPNPEHAHLHLDGLKP